MSSSRSQPEPNQNIAQHSSAIHLPLRPLPTDEKSSEHVFRILALFHEIEAGKHGNRGPWLEFQLAVGDFEDILHHLSQDEELQRFVEHKIRYDHNVDKNRLVVRLPTAVHQLFVAQVNYAIFDQIKSIRKGSDNAAAFAQRVMAARRSRIEFPVENGCGRKSRFAPDASFWHRNAQYPGVIFEVADSLQKKRRLDRLAEDYLLDSNANVQAVVGLNIEYGKKGVRKATLSVWRAQVFHTATGDELRAVKEVAHEALRDDEGNPTDHPGLRFRLSDFAHEGIVQKELGDHNRELRISGNQLCRFLADAEGAEQRGEHRLAPNTTKKKRPETLGEEVASGDEARFVEQERRVVRRVETQDSDYDDKFPLNNSSV